MRRSVCILLAVLLLAACADNGGEVRGDNGDVGIDGQVAYQQNCAHCHASGKDGAPRTGHAQDWEVRSSLWQAVLMEHAKKGFLDMPARGGKGELPDDVVNAAAQYMLEQTFPDMLKD